MCLSLTVWRSHQGVHTDTHKHTLCPSPHLPLSLSACMVAGQHSGELSSFGMTRHGTGRGRTRRGHALSLFCAFGVTNSPPNHPPASLRCFCPARAPGARSSVWHRGRRVGRLTNCCRRSQGKSEWERQGTLFRSQHCPRFPTAVCQRGI